MNARVIGSSSASPTLGALETKESQMRKLMAPAALALAIAIAAAHSALAALPVPVLPPPSRFAARVTNQWFPLLPGTVYRYRGVKDGKRALDVMTVTHLTRKIAGITSTVV